MPTFFPFLPPHFLRLNLPPLRILYPITFLLTLLHLSHPIPIINLSLHLNTVLRLLKVPEILDIIQINFLELLLFFLTIISLFQPFVE